MNRRKFLALGATGLTAGLAGCSSMSSSVGDFVEEHSQQSVESDLTVEISTTGPALLLKPTKGLPKTTVFYQDGEEVTSVSMSAVNQVVYKEIINSETASDPDERMFEPGTIELVFIGMDEEEMKRKEWEFQPYPVVEGFTVATISNYDSGTSLSETTPVFHLRNIGTGPTCISSIEITNPRTTVSLSDGDSSVDSPMLRTGSYSTDDGRVSIHQPPNQDSRLLPVERDYYLAIDGLFAVNASLGGELSSGVPDRVNQTFDVVVHTAYGESYTTTVDVAMVGGVAQSDSADSSWTHRYRTVRFDSVSYENP